MSRRRRSSVSAKVSLAVMCTLLACGAPLPQDAPAPAIDTPPLFSTSSTIGSEGGTLKAKFTDPDGNSYDVSLEIPAQALQAPTEITLTTGPDLVTGAEQGFGPALRILPTDLVLAKPFLLTFHFQASRLVAGQKLELATLRFGARDTAALAPVTASLGEAMVQQLSFGSYQIIAHGTVLPALTTTLDILFLIDNSGSMTPKQKALAQNIPKFIQRIEQLTTDYHIGIVTSDIGTTLAPGSVWPVASNCNTYAGDDGKLQTLPCSARSNLTAEAQAACQSLCPDPRYVPPSGQLFISRNGGTTNIDPGTGMDADHGPARAFQCMAFVGDGGCGVEGQLEGARRALDLTYHPEHSDFLRPASLLAVIYITDEDDCSVDLRRRAELDPSTIDCSTPDRSASYRCFNQDYRCFASSTICNEPLNTPGAKTGCQQKPGSFLRPVTAYQNAITSLRPDPRLRLVSGIWTLPSVKMGGPVQIEDSAGSMKSFDLQRGHGAAAGCFYPKDQSIYGQSQLRLTDFACGLNGSYQVSICDIDSYPLALDNIAKALNKMTMGVISSTC